MIIIRLHGHLKQLFGEIFKFEARTVKEAIHALDCNIASFRNELTKDGRRYHIVVNEKEDYADQNKIYFPLGADSVVDVIPEFEGGGFSLKGALMAIAGILLIIYAPALIAGAATSLLGSGTFAAGFASAAAAGSASTMAALGALGGGWAAAASAIGYIGTSLLTMGVASMLAPDQPKTEDEGGKKSSSLSSIENTMGQGIPIPVGYGRLLCGSNVISFITSSNLSDFWPATVEVDAATGKQSEVYHYGDNKQVETTSGNNLTTVTTSAVYDDNSTSSVPVTTFDEKTTVTVSNPTSSGGTTYTSIGGGSIKYRNSILPGQDE
jgi:predicted phage tail protein